MKIMPYDEMDREILRFIQGDIPLRSRPYQELAEHLGLSEDEVVSRIDSLIKRGVIRRMGAILRHQKAGYSVNAMTAWRVDAAQADRAGQIMADFAEVSHCYLRQVPPEFGYNLFAMLHARSEAELNQIIGEMSDRTGLKDYSVYRSIKEYKKVSMEYF